MNTARKIERQNQEITTMIVKPYTLKALAEQYGVCNKTFRKRIKAYENEIGKRIGNYYNPKQVRIIYEFLGEPNAVPQISTAKIHPASIDFFVNATWNFAKCVLWNKEYFTEAEVSLSKQYIREFYENIPAEKFNSSSKRYFIQYCERVLLAKNYIDRFAHRFIPHPCIWLDRNYNKGFAGTKYWYEQIQAGRIFNEDLLTGQRTLAELYAEYVLTNNTKVMQKAVEFFNSNNKHLNIFSCCIANYQIQKAA